MFDLTTLAPDAEGRAKQSMFAVEATTAEYHFLWANHASESRTCRFDPIPWKQVMSGFGVTIGSLAGMPVVISLNWALIDGQLVMFWHPTSQVVDHRQIEEWLAKHFDAMWDKSTRRAVCDADNFHLCLNAVADANVVKLPVPPSNE